MSDDVDPPDQAATDPVDGRIDDLAQRIDTIAGAVAAVAASQSELLQQNRQLLQSTREANEAQRQDLAATLAALAEVTGLVEQLDLEGSLRDTARELRDHTDLALAGTIRVLDERFQSLRSSLVPTTSPAASASGMGFEAGAVMGAVQAAWSRLEQRLEHDFDELSHQIADLARRIDSVEETLEAVANRPVVSAEQLRKTASSVKGAVVAVRDQRRLRRGT